MPWPAFNELGDLPVGIHRATFDEVIAHFGHGTAQRVTITARLERIYELARRTESVQRFIIFGSYVTAEPNPRDVDIFLVMRNGFQPRDAPPEAQSLFRHSTKRVGRQHLLGQRRDELCRHGRFTYWLADTP